MEIEEKIDPSHAALMQPGVEMDNFGYEPAHWFNRGKISMKYMLFCIPRTKHGIFEPPGSNRFSKEYSQPLPCPPNSLRLSWRAFQSRAC